MTRTAELAIVGATRLYPPPDPTADRSATALVIENGTLVHVGDDAAALRQVEHVRSRRPEQVEGPDQPVLDLRRLGVGEVLITPAFVDAHLHTIQAGQVMLGLDLHGVGSRDDLLDRLARQARDRPHARILIGQGWDDRGWPDPTPPTRTELDRAGRGAAVYLARVDVHSAVVSSALLDQLPDVRAAVGFRADGLVSREAHHLCRGALDRFFTDGERREAARVALRRCAELGVGTVHDLGGPHLGPLADLHRVRDAAAELGLRVASYWGELAEVRTLALAAEHSILGLAGDLCIDGAIGSRTAALRTGYADQADTSLGVRYLDDDEIRDHLITCTRAGLQGGFHCIGDDGVSAAVQGLRRAAEITGLPALRAAGHRLEHVEMVDAQDLPALAELGVTASVQPAFDATWGPPGELYEQRLGPARSAGMNPFGSMQRAGVALAFGTDAPVTPLAGWAMVHAAIRHSRAEERLSAPDAFAAATRGGHRAAGEPEAGTLAIGQPAAVAVWDCSGFAFDAAGLPRLEGGREPRCVALVVGDRLTLFADGLGAGPYGRIEQVEVR